MKPQTFRACPVIGMSYVVGIAGVAAVVWWQMKEGEIAAWAGWVGVVFFGCLAVAFLALVLFGKYSLKLYDEGFTLRLPFVPHRYNWENVRSIRILPFQAGHYRTKVVSVEVEKEILTSEECISTFELQIVTTTLLVRPNDLANMMNAWRDAALGLNERNGHSAVVRQNHTA